ncbi:glycogen synthase GlgA [Evansella tamaricis]|uniref:Glycogen synthase n=1 Tax=Evansella tamaricis TaxID=2069301 RepID=A0ABS6JJT7_9BACI|nr:glycogen synthase GlgA [Evansella tamaricis]MBU9713808.1 glycogen synthase GlgA [Evansella tamaricis]
MENVLFVASECTPFIKTGGLADVIGSLPQALKEYENMEVRVILPMYDEISEDWRKQMSFQTTFNVPLGWRNQEASLYTLEHNGILYYFISNDYYFTRKGVYGYYDDGERFVFFNQAVMETIYHIDFKPNILHAHDWQAGIAVALAKITQPVEHMKTVFTIHNIKYQGMMTTDVFHDFFNLHPSHLGGMEWKGMLNCMKSALHHADKITTVSPSYAEEIKDPYYSEGLHQILWDRSDDLIGVINGIDTDDYNPMKDPHISVNYKHSRVKKKENKEFLQEKLNLPVDKEIPLYIMITRLVEQKGLYLVERVLDEFLQENVQLAVLGTGDPEFEGYFYHLSERFPDKVAVRLTFDEGLARQMYASADFFLMPSQFEPCGLSQLMALQYKTVPIVRETGGLKDTVFPYNEETGEGNGFSFTNYNAHDLLFVLRYSLSIYYHDTHWDQLLKNVNKSKFSWKDSAHEYAKVYQQLSAVNV